MDHIWDLPLAVCVLLGLKSALNLDYTKMDFKYLVIDSVSDAWIGKQNLPLRLINRKKKQLNQIGT